MITEYANKYINYFADTLKNTKITNEKSEGIDINAGFSNLCRSTNEIKENGAVLYFVGNGASSNMSSHYAIDFLKNAGCRANCFTDDAFLTAIGNDIGYDQVFALPLKSFLKKSDCLIAISSSGNSPSILEAIKIAESVDCKIVTFTSMSENNKSRKLGNINFYVPAKTYGFAESAHHVLLHCWLDQFMKVKEWEL